MFNSKGTFIKITVTQTVLLVAYIIATLFQSQGWGNILSPLNTFAAAGILYYTYLRSDRNAKASVTLLFYALACAAWGTADTIWAFICILGGSPDENPVTLITYALTNCFLLISLIIFAIQQFKKWDLIQYTIDLVVSGFLTVVLFWILFLHKDLSILHVLLSDDFTSVLSIFTDIIICISIFSWFLSVRGGKIPAFMRIMSFGLVLYALDDMFYYYMDYNGLYFPNSLNDAIYVLALVTIAFGAVWKTYKSSTVFDLSVATNTGSKKRWFFLLLYPFLAVLFPITGVMDIQISFGNYVLFAVSIFLYWASCKYVQVSLEKEAILKHSNELLEQRVTEQVSELTFLANHDTLTTLFNRRYFMTRLDETINNLSGSEMIALLMIDMDRFKTINDTFGHDVGDKLLINLSCRLSEWNKYGAIIARLGGDEFAVMFVGDYTQKHIENFCTELLNFCSEPFDADDNVLNMTMSIGVAIATGDDCDEKTLMKHADIAMYRAKSQGYNKYQVYDSFLSQNYKKAAKIEVLLRQTDPNKNFELYYQPQYSLPDQELIGAEALIRWKDPEHGYIPPDVFIPIAEQIDYIFKLGKWVMQETIKQSIIWNKQYHTKLKIGFNISPQQFKDEAFISLIKTLVTESGVNPAWIDAEITESVMLHDEYANDNFAILRELGITVSIDDFGSGYSALGYLNKYPFDRIKIDKSLIDNINSRNISGANVVKAAIDMAHVSGIQTIAEGVETQEQLDILVEMGCDQVQGYLLGRPIPPDAFEQRYIKPYCENEKIF